MFGQSPDLFGMFWDCDWLWLWLLLVEPFEDDLPLAALAIAAPPPTMTPSAITVARPIRSLLLIDHLLPMRSLIDTTESGGRG
jgi:hypothetical protein